MKTLLDLKARFGTQVNELARKVGESALKASTVTSVLDVDIQNKDAKIDHSKRY